MESEEFASVENLISQLSKNKGFDFEKIDESIELNKNYKTFTPEPGFCLKTKSSKNEKVFINVCKSSQIAEPKDISEKELIEIIEKRTQTEIEDAAFQFRMPMSLGEVHLELDHAGSVCMVYDVCINPNFFDKIQHSPTFMGFFMSVAIEGLEEKYSLELDRNYKMLKNKKFFGKIQEQHVRTKSKPIISEINKPSESNLISSNVVESPKYKIIKEKNGKNVEILVAVIELPKLVIFKVSSKNIYLDIGEDRIVLHSRSGVYFLDIFLPCCLKQEECDAEFDKHSKVLRIRVPIASNIRIL